uniref:Hes-related family bHLH transcription factor with YRPW motif 2 n=1 Tax=Oncorhynchus mykiss TaxID=8022 RepID=A0A8C7V2T8_ONCMY
MDHLLDVAPQQQQPKLWQEKNEEGSSRREGGIESIIVYQSYVDLSQLHLKNKWVEIKWNFLKSFIFIKTVMTFCGYFFIESYESSKTHTSCCSLQGSAKLEKAEILQMTVDHLKMLQATGGKGYFDAHSLAMDFMSVGFRECLTEVARYLSSVEGLDSSDPLRVRLVSHLSTCASQREAAAMTSSMAHHQQALHPHHWAAAFHPFPTTFLQQNGLPSSDSAASRLSVEVPQRGSALLTATFSHTDSSHRAPSNGSVAPCVPPLSTSLLSLSATVHAAAAAAAAAQTFPLSFPGGFPIFTPHSVSSTSSMVASAVSPSISTTSTSQQSRDRESSSSKPYRPWGTEVGAF